MNKKTVAFLIIMLMLLVSELTIFEAIKNSEMFINNLVSKAVTDQENQIGYVKYTLNLANDTLFNGNVQITNNIYISLAQVLYDPSNGDIYVTSSNLNTVFVINGETNTIIKKISVGDFPVEMVYDPQNGYIYVSDRCSNTVTIINGETNTVVGNIIVGCCPAGMLYNPSNGYIYVAIGASNTVAIINPETNIVIANITVGLGPMSMTYSPENGYIYVTDVNGLTIINGKNNTVIENISLPLFSGPGIVYDPQNGYIYSSIGNITGGVGHLIVINPKTNSIIGNITINLLIGNMVYDPQNGYIYGTVFLCLGKHLNGTFSNAVIIINPKTNSIIGNITAGSDPIGIAYDPENGYIYVANSESGTISIISTSGKPPISTSTTSPPVTNTTVSTTTSSITLSQRSTSSVTASPIGIGVYVIIGVIVIVVSAVVLLRKR